MYVCVCVLKTENFRNTVQWHGRDGHFDTIGVRLDNGYEMGKMHSKDIMKLETLAHADIPLHWQRRAPFEGETYHKWRRETQHDCLLWMVEKITEILSEVVIKELTATHTTHTGDAAHTTHTGDAVHTTHTGDAAPTTHTGDAAPTTHTGDAAPTTQPIFICQWGLWPARLALKLFPFDEECVVCLNTLVRSLYLVGGKNSVDGKSTSPALKLGISIRFLGQFLTPALWANVQHACMNSDVSHYALRGLQCALNRDAEKKITQWTGCHTEKHLHSVLFQFVCVEVLQVFMLPNDEQARKRRRTETMRGLEALMRRIGEHPLFCVPDTPIQIASLVHPVPASLEDEGEEMEMAQQQELGVGEERAAGMALRSIDHDPGILATIECVYPPSVLL